MVSYRIAFKPSAERELRKLSRSVTPRITKAIEALANDPFPHRSEKITGSSNAYRIRVSDYRVIYTVEKDLLMITVIRVGHRREVYRKP
ncbi:MAG: type II toxin-antitoxin system RelE/ParE family toxin [Bacteroidetes bacterium]|nr:type II toxin-antitoxin system RelE/ParE family toxin [Bacteroidota bacterium]MCW5895916.1 type II toxin-antitoxin system RelE/ParE family toxin [Bacteroidota bacterium]